MFKWGEVPGGAQAFGNSAEGARHVQKQIDELNIKDVTILGHSKGAAVGATLIGLYQNGQAKGTVKNMVLIDPPQGRAWDWIWGSNTSVDAQKARVKVVVLHGAVQCGVCECESGIKNAIDIPYEATHDIRADWAVWIFEHLGIEGDAHYRKP